MNKARTYGTCEFFKTTAWCRIKQRTVNSGVKFMGCESYKKHGTRLEITKDQFYDFCEKNRHLIEEIYRSGRSPSVDRIDSNGHYSIDNIQILEVTENIRKMRREYRCQLRGIHRDSGKEIVLWSDEVEAHGFSKPKIWRCLKLTHQTHLGYFWSKV